MIKSKLFKLNCLFSAVLFFCLCVMTLPSSAAQTFYESSVKWQQGDIKRYVLFKSRRRLEAGRVKVTASARIDVEIEVLEATSEGFLISWKFGDTKYFKPQQAANPLVESSSNLLKGFKILLEIDKKGSIVDVPNWQDVKKLSIQAVNEMMKYTEKTSSLSERGLQAAAKQIQGMYDTKEMVIQNSTSEAQLFLYPLGVEYSLGDPMVYQYDSPNAIGSEPFPSEISLKLDIIDEKNDIARISWTQELDPIETRRILIEYFSKLAAEMGKPGPSVDDIPEPKNSGVGEVELYMSSGWLKKLKHVKTSVAADITQRDVLIFVEQ